MKNILGIAALYIFLSASAANAALYRVDFNGTITDGAFDGFFTYDAASLDLSGTNSNSSEGLETDLAINYTTNLVSGSFDETTAGITILKFSAGNLIFWNIGGNANGPNRVVGSSREPDFSFKSNFSSVFDSGHGEFAEAFVTDWNVQEISAVPLPAAAWFFGAGLLGLLGLKRRKSDKAPQLISR
jgi:hypothetical protein